MSNEEKKTTESILAGIWQRARKTVLLWEFIKVIIIVGGVLIGQFLILENKVAEVFGNPKRTTALEKQDSAKFIFVDSSLTTHNGYFITIFERLDTAK